MTEGAVFPTLRYRDVDAAIYFLKEAFGFEELSVDRGDDAHRKCETRHLENSPFIFR